VTQFCKTNNVHTFFFKIHFFGSFFIEKEEWIGQVLNLEVKQSGKYSSEQLDAQINQNVQKT